MVAPGRSWEHTKVGEVMTDEVNILLFESRLFIREVTDSWQRLAPTDLDFAAMIFWSQQKELITVSSDTNILQAMQLMAGKNAGKPLARPKKVFLLSPERGSLSEFPCR